jgi:hypothetical protein
MDDLRDMPSGIQEALWQMFKDGPTWDGNLLSKAARTWMVQNGLAFRAKGYNALTEEGVQMAVSLGMGERKDRVPQ